MGSQVRLDKYLAEMGMGSRSEVKKNIGFGKVLVNGKAVRKPETKIVPGEDEVVYKKQPVEYKKNVYFMLNKPAGVLSATTDKKQKTVIDLFESEHRKNLFCVGRLDKDTTGLLLVTDDGDFFHRLMSPKRNVPKVYEVVCEGILGIDDIRIMKEGVPIEKDFVTSPAELEIIRKLNDESKSREKLGTSLAMLTIYEGKFHQVKKMFDYVNKPVLKLKRVKIGNLYLDESLKPGEYRELTKEEIRNI